MAIVKGKPPAARGRVRRAETAAPCEEHDLELNLAAHHQLRLHLRPQLPVGRAQLRHVRRRHALGALPQPALQLRLRLAADPPAGATARDAGARRG